MRILISGSTGLIGTALVDALEHGGHDPIRLVRGSPPDHRGSIAWDPAAGTIDRGGLEGIDAVVHLAGEGIATRRWTLAQKKRILDSRVNGTTLLSKTVAAMTTPPSVFLSGSAIGFYGDRDDERLDEASKAGDDFVSEVTQAWESASQPLSATSVRVAHLRTGIVLSAAGGALAPQLPVFKLGLGGRIGSGKQWLSWISIDDVVGAIQWVLDNPVSGPVNLTAPGPVTNLEFTKTLGRILRRPTFLPTPRPVLWLRFGRELTTTLLESSAHVSPRVLVDSGFEFRHPELEAGLRAVLDR